MPGIFTHNRVFLDALDLLTAGKKKTFASGPVAALFSTPANMTAGLFGSAGPDIFESLPSPSKFNCHGRDISFSIHNGDPGGFTANLSSIALSDGDMNTEWKSMQRAYLYGFLSHIIADSVIYPFVFFFSGFPDSFIAPEIKRYREQNILFQYNIDSYYLYRHEKKDSLRKDNYPVEDKKIRLAAPVSALIKEALKKSFPENLAAMSFIPPQKKDGELPWLNAVDYAPFFLEKVEKIRQGMPGPIISIIEILYRKGFFSSGIFLQRPHPRRLNADLLNIHRGRWQSPTETGNRYESIDDLVKTAAEMTAEAWTAIEESLFTSRPLDMGLLIPQNAFTASAEAGYHDMVHKEPVSMRY